MRKLIFALSIALMGMFFSACEKENVQIDSQEATSLKASNLMQVSCTSARNQRVGSIFTHRVLVTNAGRPVSGVVVGINDPIRRLCTQMTTNAAGVITYQSQSTSQTAPNFYILEFVMGASKVFSSIAVSPTNLTGWATFNNFRVELNSLAVPRDATLVVSKKMTAARLSQMMNSAADLGKEIAKDYLSNPFNVGILTMAGVSCSASIVLPAAIPTCAATVKMVASGAVASTVKVVSKRWVDRTNLTTAQKTAIKNWIDLGIVAIEISRLKLDGSFESIDVLPISHDVLNTSVVRTILDSAGNLKGVSFTAQEVGSQNCIQFCCHKK